MPPKTAKASQMRAHRLFGIFCIRSLRELDMFSNERTRPWSALFTRGGIAYSPFHVEHRKSHLDIRCSPCDVRSPSDRRSIDCLRASFRLATKHIATGVSGFASLLVREDIAAMFPFVV